MHGYAPADFLVEYAGKDNLFAVPLAVLIGVHLYANAAGIIPIVHVLMEKGKIERALGRCVIVRKEVSLYQYI
jgi:uncharacterized membrane protein YraQ (UPF0718 family)